tara:strand:+ start:28091 stop:28384 length:294 start_codon:yes stop_codon:yes gene_type:complete
MYNYEDKTMGDLVKTVASAFNNSIIGTLLGTNDKPKMSKQTIKAPSSAIDEREDEDKVNLGSDRADKKGRRTGRRKLMASKSSPSASSPSESTGLQL